MKTSQPSPGCDFIFHGILLREKTFFSNHQSLSCETAVRNPWAASFMQKQASWCPMKGIFSRWYLANSCPLFEHMWQAALWLSGQISLIKQPCLVSARGRQLGYSYGGRWPAPGMFSQETNTCTVHTAALFCTCGVMLLCLSVRTYKHAV